MIKHMAKNKKMTSVQIMKADLKNMEKGLEKTHKMVQDNNLSYDEHKYLDIIFILRNQYVETIKSFLK